VIGFLGNLVYRNPESGMWSRVDAEGIIAVEGYDNLLSIPSEYDVHLDVDVLFGFHPGLGERLANLRFHNFTRVNSATYNQLSTLQNEDSLLHFIRNFSHFFAYVLGSQICEWDNNRQAYIEMNGERLILFLRIALRPNFGERQNVPGHPGVHDLRSLVRRNPENGRWSRVAEADAGDIISREGYVNLLLVPQLYINVLDGWLREYLRAQNIEMEALVQEAQLGFDIGAEPVDYTVRPPEDVD